MASRSELRRRRQLRLLALALTVVVTVTFVRDVIAAAHDSPSARTSRNTSFGTLANQVLRESDGLDQQTFTLLKDSTTLSRDEFLSRWLELDSLAKQVALDGARMAEPAVDRNVNVSLSNVLKLRIESWEQIRDTVSTALRLGVGQPPTESVASARLSIAASNATWATARHRLERQPGHVHLRSSHWKLGTAHLDDYVTTALRQVRLHADPTVSINAIMVNPQPLPSRNAQLVLLAGDSVSIGVSVRNTSPSDAIVTVHLLLSPEARSGPPVALSTPLTLPRHGNAAAVFDTVPIAASERGLVRIWVSGARPTQPGTASRIMTFKVASAG